MLNQFSRTELLIGKEGIEKLQKQLKNNISAFSGNSGVGKSTLINGIFKRDITQEGEISKRNRRGKNTTTAIKLYEINEYPDYKYIAGYHAWGGEIYKKDETD